MEMTGNRIGDAPVLRNLLTQIPPEEQIGSVTVDCPVSGSVSTFFSRALSAP